MCYCFFRIGKALPGLPAKEKILAALFLCEDKHNDILGSLKPGWNERIMLSKKEKLSLLNIPIESVFPWHDKLSNEIDSEKFCYSFFVQPDLFLRLRPGKEKSVKQKLTQAAIDFEVVSDSCLALPNASKIDTVIELNKKAVIQDYSSQQVGRFLSRHFSQDRNDNPTASLRVWDCCAASGGKSILLHDLLNANLDLTVSDIRKSIIVNLEKRFREAGLKKYKSLLADLTQLQLSIPGSPFDLIIADVPCTGSGTWSRTPEQLYFFDLSRIDHYASLQKKIISNVIPQLSAGGYLLYITCSVFKEENEETVKFTRDEFQLELIEMKTFNGYDKKADTMFAALLQKPL